MKKVWNFLNTTLGVGLLVALVLVLVALFGGRNVVGPTGQPLATAVVEATPTSAPEPPFSVEDIQIARRYPLEVEGEVLADNPWNLYPVPLFSPDGTTMLFRKRVIGGDELWKTDSQGKAAQRLLEKVWEYAWSPDGEWIAYTQSISEGGASLWVMRADGSEKQQVGEQLKTGQVQWSGEGRLVYMAANRSIMDVGRDGARVRQLVPPLIPSANRFAISPQGDRLALATEPEVWLINLEKPEEPISIAPYYGAFEGSIAWSPDGSKVAYSSRSSIYIVDKDGEHIANVKTAWQPWDLAWSPDGKVLAFIGRTEERGLSFEIYLLDAENKRVKQLTDDREGNVAGGMKYSLTWSPDGSRLIYGTSQLPGQKVQVIELTTNTSQGKGYDKAHVDDAEGKILPPFSLGAQNSRTPVLSDCPYQEGNDGTIWVYRQRYCPPEIPPEECTQQIPFEIGIYEEDPTWSNYLGGVLEYEIGGTTETPLEDWQPEMARGFSVAARTVATFWCPRSVVTDVNRITHYGLNDWQYQAYRPGWSAARAEDYRGFVADTESEYLTYNGNLVSALQYRSYSGRMTEAADPNPPHKSIYDPVAAVDEPPGPGLGQHSANHWAMGLHNEQLGEPVNVPNVQWSEYRQILVHYYTGVHVEEHEGPILTPNRRWNMLEHDVPTTMTAGQQYPLTVVLQNTGVDPWTAGDFYLGYRWCDAGGVSCSNWTAVPLDAASWPVNPGDLAAAELTVQIPASPASYLLRFDLSGPGQNNWFGEQSPHPWFVQDIPLEVTALTPGVKELTIVSHDRWYEPATRRFAAVQEAGPTPGSPYALPQATPIWGQEHLDGTTTILTERFSIPEQATDLNGTVKFLVDKGIVTLKLNATPIAQYDAYYQPTPQAYPLTSLLPGLNVFQADLYNRARLIGSRRGPRSAT
ncbi:MAG: hypothetical protein NUW24_15830 [Anaerolineae bacterium]|jgi:Tol biopolymer transport system component|nr:hypothetical protein [Anaerolineae bacterium]MDH7475582.1 hypothetical protein [Anaerolineae bacterium]